MQNCAITHMMALFICEALTLLQVLHVLRGQSDPDAVLLGHLALSTSLASSLVRHLRMQKTTFQRYL